MSKLLQEIGVFLGFHKVIITTAYTICKLHDGLVDRYNRTLTGMLVKKAELNGIGMKSGKAKKWKQWK